MLPHDSRGHRVSPRSRVPVLALALVVALLGWIPGAVRLVDAQEGDGGFSPASGNAHVIAQGVVALPTGDVVWRTVRTRAALEDAATFEVRPLGFVLATGGPLLLVDGESGEQVRLGTGEATLVDEGTMQRRSSLGGQAVSYLSIELVAVDAPAPPADTTVLQPGQPFPAPAGMHDLDLLSATLSAAEPFIIPDSGQKNVVLVTAGAADVGRPGGDPVVLLAGEAASFSGELQIATAADGGAEGGVSFVVAMIGPEVPPPTGIEAAAEDTPEPAAAATAATEATAASASGAGTIVIQIYTCPPGMDAQTVAAAVCAPTSDDVDVTLSGENLTTALTLADATPGAGTFTWSGLPYGDYIIAETTMPAGSTTYILSAANTSGDPSTGYRVTLDEATPELSARIYNFNP